MRTGTKSVLFGYHQFLLHPLVVAVAWTKLYGFPFDPRLWIAFFVHDLGYLGKRNMDDPIGETHPEFGAKIMSIFGKKWSDFALLHSRFYSNRLGKPYSKLCVVDKLAYLYYPNWLILFLCSLSGEMKEYTEIGQRRGLGTNAREVIAGWKTQSRQWLAQHIAGHQDLMTAQLRKMDNDAARNE